MCPQDPRGNFGFGGHSVSQHKKETPTCSKRQQKQQGREEEAATTKIHVCLKIENWSEATYQKAHMCRRWRVKVLRLCRR